MFLHRTASDQLRSNADGNLCRCLCTDLDPDRCMQPIKPVRFNSGSKQALTKYIDLFVTADTTDIGRIRSQRTHKHFVIRIRIARHDDHRIASPKTNA